jgi:predicted DNA-binding transcriptional regulator AlpA
MRGGLSAMAFNSKVNEILEGMNQEEIKALLDKMDLITSAEVAKMLGWSVSKVSVYGERGKLPVPITVIGGRPVWTRAQIERFKNKGGAS